MAIPAGDAVILPQGAQGTLTQALGGSFTLYLDGNLYRIVGNDADALGKERVELPTLAVGASDTNVEELVWDQMRTCFDPEIPVNIVDLGLVGGEFVLTPRPGVRTGRRKVLSTC